MLEQPVGPAGSFGRCARCGAERVHSGGIVEGWSEPGGAGRQYPAEIQRAYEASLRDRRAS
jgi:hypothetical protein